MENLNKCTLSRISDCDDESRRVKIAILDSGYTPDDPMIQDLLPRIKETRTWSKDGNPAIDHIGHGTHITALLLRVVPFADIYIGQIARLKATNEEHCRSVAEVIQAPYHVT